MKKGDVRSRKWLLTINNPLEKGFTHDVLKDLIFETKQCVYWCMSDETGGVTQTFHTHIYMACNNAVQFSVLFKRFPGAHFDVAKGTSSANRDYVFKEGKWLKDDKSETNHRDSHEEGGDLPLERQGMRNDLADVYDMIKQGMDNYEILEQLPQYMLHTDKLDRTRRTIIEQRYRNQWRDLSVFYVYGSAGSGKTRSIMEKYGYENVYRVTDYEHPFDGYREQDVIVFEEFRSNLKIGDMLNYLDGYPLELPCRFLNKVACFTKVFIVSNIPLSMQYSDIQRYQKETWDAFLRRIHNVNVFSGGVVHEYSIKEYFDGFIAVSSEDVPFEQKKFCFD